jgi:hypothetical protein
MGLTAWRRAADVEVRGIRRYLLGDAIRLLLIRIARRVDPHLRFQRRVFLAALVAFVGKIGNRCAARALARQKPSLQG